MRRAATLRMSFIVIKSPRSRPGSGKLAVAVRSKNSTRAWVIFQSAHWVNFRSAPTNKAAFLDYLLNLDLTGFNIRNFPITDALRQQYTESLTSMAIWWMSVLSSGRLLLGKWPNIVTVRQIALNWETWAKDNAVSTFDRRRGNDTAIGMFLSGKRGEPKFIGSKIKEGSGYSYKMLDLNVARVAFIKRFDMPADLFGGEYDE